MVLHLYRISNNPIVDRGTRNTSLVIDEHLLAGDPGNDHRVDGMRREMLGVQSDVWVLTFRQLFEPALRDLVLLRTCYRQWLPSVRPSFL